MQHSTLKKLSETLGISVSTVARALKDHPDVADETRKKVKELAEVMEYEPNYYAIKLRTRQSNVLGVLIPGIDNFFYDSFIAAVEDEARVHGYSVMIMQTRDSAGVEEQNLHLFRKNMVTGLFAAISIETEDMTPFRKLIENKVPIVFIDRVPEKPGFTKVSMSDELAARLAAQAIIAKKKNRVLALFGHPHLSISRKRYASFTGTFRQLSPGTELLVDYTENITESKRVTMQMMSQAKTPDVIFCMGDLILIGVMQAIHQLNLKVPDEIAVVSISNGLIPTLYNPVITHVETNGYKLGKLAFKQMMCCLRNETSEEEVFVEPVLIEGGSL